MENITGWTVPVVLSKDKAFQCVCPRFTTNEARGGNVTMYPLFGEHGDCVMFNRADNPAGKIGLHLCHQFLRLNGTELQYYTLQSKDIIECYSALRLKYFDPNQKNKKVQPSKFRGKLVMNTKRTDSYFVNAHHYETFQTSLSRTLAQMQQGQITNTALLKATYPKTLDALTQLGYV